MNDFIKGFLFIIYPTSIHLSLIVPLIFLRVILAVVITASRLINSSVYISLSCLVSLIVNPSIAPIKSGSITKAWLVLHLLLFLFIFLKVSYMPVKARVYLFILWLIYKRASLLFFLLYPWYFTIDLLWLVMLSIDLSIILSVNLLINLRINLRINLGINLRINLRINLCINLRINLWID